MRTFMDIDNLRDVLAGNDPSVVLATTDGGEICIGCAIEHKDQILDSTSNALGDGWGVSGICAGGEANCDCCGETFDLD